MDRVEKFDGKVALEICDQFVRLFWIRDVSDKERKNLKQSLLKEFEGKLVIDFRKNGSSTVMNDMVGIIPSDIDIISLKDEIVDAHERASRRSPDHTTRVNENQIKLFNAETLKGEITITFYIPQRKVVAQANPDTLRHFVRIYGNAINKLTNGSRIPNNQIVSASQEWELNAEEFTASQEQSELDICLEEWNEAAGSTALPTEDEFTRLSQIEPNPTEHSRPVSEEIFMNFQKSISSDFHCLKEMQKEVLDKLPALAEVIKRVDEVERKLALANGELLIQNEAIAKLQAKNDDLTKRLRDQKAEISKTEKDYRKISEDVANNRSEIATVKSASSHPDLLGRISSFEAKMTARMDGFVNSIDNRIKESVLSASSPAATSRSHAELQSVTHDRHSVKKPSPAPPVAQQPQHPAGNASKAIFNSEVILFIDSNGKHIDERILANGTSTQKCMVYTIPQAIEVLQSCVFEKQPKKILFHLGTNDLDQATPDQIADKMNNLLQLTRSRCPQTKIYVSAVMPRRSSRVADIEALVDQTNAAYGTLIGSMPGCFLIDHTINISIEMVSDDKHLDKLGFYTMLANFRFFMFNILPRSRRSR